MDVYQIVIAIVIILFVLYFKTAYKQDKLYEQEIKKSLDEDVIFENKSPEINDYLLNDYKSIFLSSHLMDLKIFQVNQYYYQEKSGNLFVFEGIEMKFSKGFFSIGFSSEYEYNMFQATPFHELYEGENDREINTTETQKLSVLIGKKIVDVSFKTAEFNEVVDYTMKVEKVTRIVEVLLTFETNETLQIATVNYDYEENKPPKNYRYDITGELLISLNHIIEIKKF